MSVISESVDFALTESKAALQLYFEPLARALGLKGRDISLSASESTISSKQSMSVSQGSVLTLDYAEENLSKTRSDFSPPIQIIREHVRAEKRARRNILVLVMLIIAWITILFYHDSNLLSPMAKTVLTLWLSWVFASLVREFSRSLDRLRDLEDQSTALWIYETYGNDSEQAEKILRLLRINRELSPRDSSKHQRRVGLREIKERNKKTQ